MENQPEYVSSNFHRLQVTKGKWNAREKARKRYVKIIHCSRWEIFFRCKYFRPREKRFLRNENDDSRSKIYAGISRHCWSVRFLRIRTARRERARKDKTYATRLWYIHRGNRGFASALRDFWKYFPFVACKRNFRGQVSCRERVKRMPRIFVYAAVDCREHIRPEWIIMPEHRRKRIPPILNSLDIVGRSIDYPAWLLCVKSRVRMIFLSCAQEIFFFKWN